MNHFAVAAVPTEAEPLGKLYNHVITVETFSKTFKSSPTPETVYSMFYQETGGRARRGKDLPHTYWALETSVLPVDAASGEPHVGFLKQESNTSLCALLTQWCALSLEAV